MRLHGYPEYDEHKKKHEAMTARVAEFKNHQKDGGTRVLVDLSNYLKGWLQKHICETDKLYGPFLKSKGVN